MEDLDGQETEAETARSSTDSTTAERFENPDWTAGVGNYAASPTGEITASDHAMAYATSPVDGSDPVAAYIYAIDSPSGLEDVAPAAPPDEAPLADVLDGSLAAESVDSYINALNSPDDSFGDIEIP